MGLAQAIASVVEDVAGHRAVERVSVRVGSAQAMTVDSLAFNFTLLTEGTPLASAVLDVTPVAGDGVRVDEIVLDGGDVIRPAVIDIVEPPHAAEDHHRHPAWQ
ncbi:MAG: hydrogenase maturation nickel metallochaperone HypA [Candidatus Dormibacteria bacterium]